jgi:hypothetical protein
MEVLRQEIFKNFRMTVFVWAVINNWYRKSPVAVTGIFN